MVTLPGESIKMVNGFSGVGISYTSLSKNTSTTPKTFADEPIIIITASTIIIPTFNLIQSPLSMQIHHHGNMHLVPV